MLCTTGKIFDVGTDKTEMHLQPALLMLGRTPMPRQSCGISVVVLYEAKSPCSPCRKRFRR